VIVMVIRPVPLNEGSTEAEHGNLRASLAEEEIHATQTAVIARLMPDYGVSQLLNCRFATWSVRLEEAVEIARSSDVIARQGWSIATRIQFVCHAAFPWVARRSAQRQLICVDGLHQLGLVQLAAAAGTCSARCASASARGSRLLSSAPESHAFVNPTLTDHSPFLNRP